MPVKAPVRAQRVYARVTGGSRQLWCPDCGCFIYVRVPLWTVVVKVSCSSCEAVFYWGSTLWRPGPGVDDVPPDILAPQFADVQLTRRKQGRPVNQLRVLQADGSWLPLSNLPKVPKP